jgi:hypothetical protein|tara:strand:- start:7200 stop:8540 length:1341 start_codon:yes stop_codon:yes gene_type:complete
MAKEETEGKSVAERRMWAINHDPHVMQLSAPIKWITNIEPKGRKLSKEERWEMTFYMRKFWAINLLQNMREELNWSWAGVEGATGMSRQSWNNVVYSKFVTQAQLQIKDPEEKTLIRKEWRPVTKRFIHEVTQSLQKHNYSIQTEYFVNAFKCGLTVLTALKKDNKRYQEFELQRINDRPVGPLSDGLQDGQWLSERREDLSMEVASKYMFAFKNKEGVPYEFPSFPLLDVFEEMYAETNCFEWQWSMEQQIFECDPVSGEPDRLAVAWHQMWVRDEDMKRMSKEHAEHFPEPPKPTDPNKWKDVSKTSSEEIRENMVSTIGDANYSIQDFEHMMQVGIIDELAGYHYIEQLKREEDLKPKDLTHILESIRSTPPLTPIPTSPQTKMIFKSPEDVSLVNDGFLPSVSLPFDVHPKWLDPNGDGQVEFSVKISFKAGVKSGSAISLL